MITFGSSVATLLSFPGACPAVGLVVAALAGALGAFWLNRAIWGGVKRKSDKH